MRALLFLATAVALCAGLVACGSRRAGGTVPGDAVADLAGKSDSEPTADAAEIGADAAEVWGDTAEIVVDAVGDGAPDGLVAEAPTDVDEAQPLPILDPSGCYDLSATMDVSGCGAAMVAILTYDFLYDPGTFIADMTVKTIRLYFGSSWDTLPYEKRAALTDAVRASVNDWLLVHPTTWTPCLTQVLADLEPRLSLVGIAGRLQLGPSPGNGSPFLGTVTWLDTYVAWDPGCEMTSACEAASSNPLQGLCAHDDASDTCRCPVDACPDACSESALQAAVQGSDQLNFDAFPLPVDPGRANRFVLNELFVPWATAGQFHKLDEALASIVDCQGVADGVPPDVLADVGLDKSLVKGCCDGAISILLNPLEEAIGAFYFTTQLALQGSATLLDENHDLVVDKLAEGAWLAHALGQPQPAFPGTFEGVRGGCP